MKNLLTTIPQKGDLKHWADVEKILRGCNSEEDFWSFSCRYFPKDSGPGACCFIVHSGFVRGYFTVLEFTDRDICRYGADQQVAETFVGNKVLLAVWHPILPIPKQGFQGWHYTELRP